MNDLEKIMSLTWEYRPQDGCYAAGGICYCDKPVVPELQSLNIYVPEALMEKDGAAAETLAPETPRGTAYAPADVPIVFYNDIGGYAECSPAPLTPRNRRFLNDGFVLVSVGARGRQTRDAEGRACGKAPAALVDLKAAVRWLRAHRDELPAGSTDRIVSVGTSAGGAMSSLVATSGNSALYLPYLEQIGACMDECDNIFAAQCYCPIVDLEHADMAYEWMFRSKRIYTMGAKRPPEVLDAAQTKLSQALAAAYPAYVNSLPLGIELGEDGRSGSYYRELMEHLSTSLETFLQAEGTDARDRAALLTELDPTGAFTGARDKDGAPQISDLDAYVRAYIGRMKGCPAFDPMSGVSPENQELGEWGAAECASEDKRHFAPATAKVMRGLAMGEASAYEADLTEDRAERARLINPMAFATGAVPSDVAPHVRIRVGSRDADHSFSASFNLYRALVERGIDADYGIVWGRGHCDADRSGEFSAWVDRICGASRA